MTHKLVQSLYV